MAEHIVFVLGAGFTRAFVPRAPLLHDDYGIPILREQFAAFPTAQKILDEALADGIDGRVDLERLMTRLTGMPYDGTDARRELALVESVVRKTLVRRLEHAKNAGVDWAALHSFATFVLDTGASIVTFNYDDVVDEALWRVKKIVGGRSPAGPYWHPDGGYGFFCRPSVSTVADESVFKDDPRSLLLKLHGSLNWRARLGDVSPRGPAALLHHESWLPQDTDFRHVKYSSEAIEAHLEADPFIIAPVLVKPELVLHPVLRVVWELAHRALSTATRVIFMGYSLPVTDLAARTLFRETLFGRPLRIQVSSLAGDSERELKASYRATLGTFTRIEFDFSGAKAFVATELSASTAPENAEASDSLSPRGPDSPERLPSHE